jgi:hypothetical protein
MAEAVHWLDGERIGIVLECGPLILLGIAWLALRPSTTQFILTHDDSEQQLLKGRRVLPMSTVPERTR